MNVEVCLMKMKLGWGLGAKALAQEELASLSKSANFIFRSKISLWLTIALRSTSYFASVICYPSLQHNKTIHRMTK